jgi:cyclopropane-fatty-acyl-phospholipid synthase
VRIHLRDYREMDVSVQFDKIASIGMFEHVGHANLGAYFSRIHQLLVPGGLVLNHGITAGGLDMPRNWAAAWGISSRNTSFPVASCCT